MKKIALVAVALLFSGSIFAATLNVGVIDLQKIVQKSPKIITMRKQMQTSLQAQVKPQAEQMKKLQAQLQQDVENLRKNAPTMTAKQKKTLQDSIVATQAQLQKMQGDVQQKLMDSQNGDMMKLMKTIQDAVAKVAKAEKLNLVVAKTSVAYSDSSMDVTDKVIAQL